MFRDFFAMTALRGRDASLRIRIDISEDDQAYTVNAEIPGLSKEDIKVSAIALGGKGRARTDSP